MLQETQEGGGKQAKAAAAAMRSFSGSISMTSL